MLKYFLKSFKFCFYAVDEGAGGGTNQGTEKNAEGGFFSGELVEKKDPISQQSVKIPKELEPYIGHIISSTRTQVESQYKPMLEKIQSKDSELEEVMEELTKLKELNLTAEEKAQKNAERKIKEYELKINKALEDVDSWEKKYRKSKIENDIVSSFKDVTLNNPKQTLQNLIIEGNPKIQEVLDSNGQPTGREETILTLNLINDKDQPETIEGTPEELFKVWVNLPKNLHHQKNSLIPGGGSNNSNGKGGHIDLTGMSPEQMLKIAHRKQ